MDKPIIISGQEVHLGENKEIKIRVARLPSGTRINLELHVFRAKEPGPTALVLAGVHGDEINGVETVRRTVAEGLFKNLKKGSVIVIPMLNIYGFIHFSRDVPDGKDVNRSFPGSSKGSLASRVAYILFNKILPFIDFGVDFHTGGGSRYNFPQIRFSANDEESENLARAFAAPILLRNKPIAKSLRREALNIGKPILVYEGGEALRFDKHSIEEGFEGLRRVLCYKGMLEKCTPSAQKPRFVNKSKWHRAKRAGMFLWSKKSGDLIKTGDLLGTIYEPHGRDETFVISKQDGLIIGHNNAPIVHQGDALFHIAYLEKDSHTEDLAD